MNAEIVSVGNELLDGSRQNTNALWLADRLIRIGIQTKGIIVVGDDSESIQNAVSQSIKRAKIVLVTGGLGPTHDDVTKESLAKLFGCKLVENTAVKNHIINLFAERGRQMPESNLDQSWVPNGAGVLHNEIGTAPGLYFEKEDSHCFVMPGVPAEMKRMTEKKIVPILRERFELSQEAIIYQTIHTTGIFESSLFEKLAPISEIEKYASISFLPHLYGVDLRLKIEGLNEDKSETYLKKVKGLITDRISPFIYEIGDRRLEEVVADLLIDRKKTVAVAESCTGGLLANFLTNISGSSAYFLGGMIAYDDSVKTNSLGVRQSTLDNFGAVSQETAREMAEGVRNLLGADLALATTGIAGPTGGTPQKPVGTVYFGLAGSDGCHWIHRVIPGDRETIRHRAVNVALHALLRGVREDGMVGWEKEEG